MKFEIVWSEFWVIFLQIDGRIPRQRKYICDLILLFKFTINCQGWNNWISHWAEKRLFPDSHLWITDFIRRHNSFVAVTWFRKNIFVIDVSCLHCYIPSFLRSEIYISLFDVRLIFYYLSGWQSHISRTTMAEFEWAILWYHF